MSDDATTEADEPAPPSEAPTVLQTPGTGRRRPLDTGGTEASRTSATSGTAATTAHNPETVLRRLEIEQTRNVGMMGMVFNAIALVAAPFIGGDPVAFRIFMASAVVALGSNAYRYFISTEARYGETHLLVFIAFSAFTNTGAAYYLGVFGPVLIIYVIDQYNACLYYDRRIALATLFASCVPVVCLGGTYALELVPDPGLFTAPRFGPIGRMVMIGIYVFLMITIFAQTLKTRQVTVESLTELDAAVRLASRREALFIEARQDLEQALRAGGFGRFSEQILGSFQLGAIIGRGGMGEVYEAVHVETDEPAAVKMLLPEVLDRPSYVRRFMREVRIAASLASPHVVEVLEVGDESAPLPYLAMERLRGESLAQILRRERRLDEAGVRELVGQVAEGIEAAHAAGIVHRDLKPQNLFLTSGGVWKILDFGISKLADAATMTGAEVLGTPQYMAPEQVDGDVDARADVYGLAAVAYRALTGRQPFVGSDFSTLVVDVVTKMPLRPTVLATEAHHDIDFALAIGLAKDPDDRFATATELARAIDAALRGRLGSSLRSRAREVLSKMPWRTEMAESG